MIRTETVCICDGCGFRTKAKAAGSWRNETNYTAPDGWRVSENPNVHFCPTCVKRLGSPVRGESNV